MLFSKRSSAILLGASLLAIGALPSVAASPSIVFTHNGKAVSSIPLDKLSELSVTVSTGGSTFKQVFAGQWSGLDQAQTLKATPFIKGAAFPDLENAHSWPNFDLAVTSGDSTWGGLKSLTASMRKGAIELSLFKASSEHDLAFTSLFYRKDYTGKTVWQNNGWVQETRWQALGNALGQATLKLDPPTFAASLDPKVLFAPAVEKFNTDKTYYSTRAEGISQTLLYPTSYGGRKVTFDGSKVIEFTLAEGGKPVFNWNYKEKDKSEYIQAEMTVNMKIQAVMNTTMEALPIPTKMEATFNCPIRISANRDLGAAEWTVSDLEYNDSIR
ncbi:MAG: hypothetical protein AB7I41_11875, partial [Candidatus Sericytochromatia bacterium]